MVGLFRPSVKLFSYPGHCDISFTLRPRAIKLGQLTYLGEMCAAIQKYVTGLILKLYDDKCLNCVRLIS